MNYDKLSEQIETDVANGFSVALIGPSDSGKTWFVKNILVPKLESKQIRCHYISDSIHNFSLPGPVDLLIADEFETLSDRKLLEKLNIKDKPYYPPEYVNRVEECHRRFRQLDPDLPILFIITRNNSEGINSPIQPDGLDGIRRREVLKIYSLGD